MIDAVSLVLRLVASLFKSRARLEAEVLLLRHQLAILQRRASRRPHPSAINRLIFVWAYRHRASVLDAICIVKPEAVVRWHRAGFRWYWRWKSRSIGGRPPIANEWRCLIRKMSEANPLWGAPRFHGELMMLGIEVAQSTVAKYMSRGRRPPSQSWKTFPRNHAAGIAVAARSPWQNGIAERLIGSIRRECLDHIVASPPEDSSALYRLLQRRAYALVLGQDAPIHRAPCPLIGAIVALPILGGLHHQYV